MDQIAQPFANLAGSPAPVAASAQEDGFSFAGFRLEPDGTLFHGERPVHLPPKELAALRLLLAHAGRIVTPLQMRQALWGEVHVSADSVPKCVSSLRARLRLEDCIQTVYKRGYRFSAKVQQFGAAPDGPLARLVVAPFATAPGVPEYLGATLAEETAAGLTRARHPSVSVLAHDSVCTLARRGLMAYEIGNELKADFVLTGTLRALSSHFRLIAEMIRVQDGVQVWAEEMMVERSQAAELELELARRLNFRLNAGLPTEWPQAPGLSIAAAADPEDKGSPLQQQAYEIFQHARHEWRTLQRQRMQEGLRQLQRAIELDPSLTEARVDLANLCVAQSLYGYMAPDTAARIVRDTATDIFDLAGRAEAMLPALGWISFYFDHDLPAALRAFSLSSHLPHDPWITRARSMFALSRHRFPEAIEMLRAAIAQDPFSPRLHARLAWALHLAGQARESLDQAHCALEKFPAEPASNFYGAVILAFNGEAKRAIAIAEDMERRLPNFDPAAVIHAYALARAGDKDTARAILEQLDWRSRERFVISSLTPAVYVELDQPDDALQSLRTAMQDRCPWFFQMLADPRLKPLHSQPEFKQMRSVLTTMEAEAAPAPGPR